MCFIHINKHCTKIFFCSYNFFCLFFRCFTFSNLNKFIDHIIELFIIQWINYFTLFYITFNSSLRFIKSSCFPINNGVIIPFSESLLAAVIIRSSIASGKTITLSLLSFNAFSRFSNKWLILFLLLISHLYSELFDSLYYIKHVYLYKQIM